MTSVNVLHDIHHPCCTAPAQSNPTTAVAIIVNNLAKVIRKIIIIITHQGLLVITFLS